MLRVYVILIVLELLMGRGIGEATCQRLMRKVQRGDKEALLEAIHIAEIEYARTRRFWG